MPGGLNLIGGLLRGMGQGRQQRLDREDRQGGDALKKQLINLQISNAKTKQKELEIKNQLVSAFIQNYQQKQQATQNAEATPASTVPDEGADKSRLPKALSGGSMDPTMAAMMKYLTGLDLPAAGRLQAQQGNLDQRKSQDEWSRNFKTENEDWDRYQDERKFDREGSQYVGEDIVGPGGVTKRVYRNKWEKPPSLTTQVKKPKGAEAAGKIATIRSALQNMPYLKKSYINEDGTVNRKTVFNSNMPGGGTPRSEGRQVRAQYLEALDAKIRAMTGAAINAEEIPYYDQQFYPSYFDTDKGIKDKLDRMERFLGGFLSEMAPGEPVNPKDVLRVGGKKYKVEPKLKVGTIQDGHRYKGGDPADQNNWEKVKK